MVEERTICAMLYTGGLPFLLCAFNQKTKAVKGWDPNGCMVKISVNRRVFQLVRNPVTDFTVYGLPSGLRPAFSMRALAILISYWCVRRILYIRSFNPTCSVKIQFGFAVPGVSGRKKYAKTAMGNEMTPFITGVILSEV